MDLTAATRLLRDGLNLRLAEQRGAETDWACDRTRQRFTFTHEELAVMIGERTAEFQTHDAPPPAMIVDPDQVEASQRAAAEERLEYVLDMHAASLAHRAKLTEFEAQIHVTAKRLDDECPPEAWTVKRWLKRAGEEPCWQKLLDRTELKGNREPRLTDDQLTLINEQIDLRYLKRERLSPEGLAPFIRNAIRLANLSRPADDRIENVGRRSILSVIAMRSPREVHAKRFGEAAARAKFDRVELQADPEAPLDRIEIDHTVGDLYVVSDEDGLPIGRPTIGFAIDRCTRMPFGVYIGFEPESVLSIMQILKNGIFPKTYVREKISSGEWDLKHDWPVWGMPRGLVFDRGMSGLNHDIRQAALEIGIRDVSFMAARSGHQKGAIERFFRTQNQRLLHQQRGTTYSNVMDRGDYDPLRNAVVTYSSLMKMAHRFITDIYPYAKHGGLGGDQPIQRWNRLIDRHPSDPVKPIEQMIHLFTRSKIVALRREGVRLRNLHYHSDELDMERLSADFAKASPRGSVQLRYDPADLGHVWIRLPHRPNRYLRVPVIARWADYASGRSIWEHQQVLRHHRTVFGSTYDPDSLAESRVALSADLDEADRTRRRASTSKRRARLDGVGRKSPAGSDHSTTPDGSVHGRRVSDAKAKEKEKTPTPANDARAPIGRRGGSIEAGGRRRIKTISLGPTTGKDRP